MERKNEEMESTAWRAGKGMDGGNMSFEHGKQGDEVCAVESLWTMVAFITAEADATIAFEVLDESGSESFVGWHEVCKRAEVKPERKKHGRCPAVVEACILHSGEGWRWTKELVDTLLHAWESRNLEVVATRNRKDEGISLELFQAYQICMARMRFAKNGGEEIECHLI